MGFLDLIFGLFEVASNKAQEMQKEADKMAAKSDDELKNAYRSSNSSTRYAAGSEFKSRVEAQKSNLGNNKSQQQLKSIAQDESRTLSERKAAYDKYQENKNK